MDITTTPPHSKFSCRKKLSCLPFSFKKSCFFFLTFILLIVLVLGLLALIIFLILKPQKPFFSIQTAKIESYKLDDDTKDLFVSSVVSLTIIAANPNRVGISYSTTRLRVLQNGLVIGMIRIPRFHQPPQSKNISLQAQVMFECVNVSDLTSGKSVQENSRNGNSFQMRILGDIRAQVRIHRATLPKLRIALDCDIMIDQKHLAFNYEMNSMKDIKNANMISLPTVSKLFSNKCSLGIYV
ncbi:hypothetical protein ACH5RR_007870 [Cinchona calisaya]|uniref:Late embryogenesis abundant protein LEA-2 subgroup domain-containing protein n=1 Tax=Cinchona calisaya TaxID=153742 RepID=A0ABD3ABL1_9GENT